MKARLLTFLLALSFAGSAQIELLFESKLDYTLLIGIDGFVQNPEPVSEAVITGLDTGLHAIDILAMGKDTLLFNKKIRLLEKDKQHYVLEEDFQGNKNLHYRGFVERFPLKAMKLKQQKLLAYNPFIKEHFLPKHGSPTPPKEKVVATNTPPHVAKASNEARETAKELVQTASKVPESTLATAAKLQAEKDSLNLYIRSQKAKVAANAFPTAVAKIQGQDFEFEKLQTALAYVNAQKISLEEVKELAALLRFDDSRLQLCTLAKKKLSETEKPALADVFQFEYSRNAYLQTLK
jgi:hypothetical protein